MQIQLYTSNAYQCKHQLATIVGDLIGKVVVKEVTDAEYAKLLCAGDLPDGVS